MQWQDTHNKLASCKLNNNKLCTENIISLNGFDQNCFDLSKIKKVYVGYEFFKVLNLPSAHTFWFFEFEDDTALIATPEARKSKEEEKENVSFLKGVIKHYPFVYLLYEPKAFELYKDHFELYELELPKEKMMKLLKVISININKKNKTRESYNILFNNCARQLAKDLATAVNKKAKKFHLYYIFTLNISTYLKKLL
jgi:hypothetical protein